MTVTVGVVGSRRGVRVHCLRGGRSFLVDCHVGRASQTRRPAKMDNAASPWSGLLPGSGPPVRLTSSQLHRRAEEGELLWVRTALDAGADIHDQGGQVSVHCFVHVAGAVERLCCVHTRCWQHAADASLSLQRTPDSTDAPCSTSPPWATGWRWRGCCWTEGRTRRRRTWCVLARHPCDRSDTQCTAARRPGTVRLAAA